ncbi:hypothetical protein BX600DRAFT_224296 [Xylariales sp. PMI_506]|nr:hypothetical protein BX600DRAFT_224296 [Xylariales sp. PMI_506]
MSPSTSKVSVLGPEFRWRGRRSNPAVVSGHGKPRVQLAMIIATIACWVSTATAISLDYPPRPLETLIIDERMPVKVGSHWVMMSQEEHQQHLARRANAESHSSSSSSASTSDSDSTTTLTIAVTTTTSSASATKATTTTSSASSALPSPFDSVLSSNFSGGDNCPTFIESFLADATFKSCYPFSMLVQGSTSFFQAQKSLVTMTQVLDATCNTNSTFCTTYLDSIATNLTSSANCASDYQKQNSLVVEAYIGLKSYQPLYSAACLKDTDNSEYCYANAITNSSAVSDSYLYFLPLNQSYPNATAPTCDLCTQQTMGIFQAATADRSSFIANTYKSAAETVNNACGQNFVNATLPASVTSSSPLAPYQASPLLLLSFIAIALTGWL